LETVDKLLAGRQVGFFFDGSFVFVPDGAQGCDYGKSYEEFLQAHATDKHHCHADCDGDDSV